MICVSAEVSVLSGVQTLYDRSPKLRIKVSGISDIDIKKVSIVLGAQSQPLKGDKDYLLTKDDDGDALVFKLLSNRK